MSAPLRLIHAPLLRLATPALHWLLRRRLARGKEDATRLGERRGQASLPRPAGELVWVHGASIGEAMSALGLIDLLLAARSQRHVLVTTGTLSSAALLAGRLPPRAFHQFVPLDHPAWVKRFLDHWRPDGVIWLESELWPGLLSAISARRLPAALVNGRLSARSARRWRRLRGVFRAMMATFGPVLMKDAEGVAAMHGLGIARAQSLGDLKADAVLPPPDIALLERLRALLGNEPAVAMISSHRGEEAAVFAALSEAPDAPRLLLVPRHAERGREIAALAASTGIALARPQEVSAATAQVLLLDRFGVVATVLAVAQVAVIGGSFIPHGGQNPIEPILAEVAVIHGPSMENFAELVAELTAADAVRRVPDPGEALRLARALLDDPAMAGAQAARARAVIARHQGASARVAAVIEAMLAGRQ